MLKLRHYQSELVVRALRALARSGSVVVQLETGAGKTHIAAEMCRSWVRAKKRVRFIAHRREILDQARAVFDESGIKHGSGARVQFKMISAAMKGGEAPPDVLIFDECHHAPAESWRKVAAAYPKALRLGLTATPNRLDGAALSDIFAEIEHGPAARDLRANGHLARYRYFAPVLPDLSSVKVRDREYDRGSIAEIMTGASIVGDVVEHYRKHAEGKRAILFAVSVAASEDMAARFNAARIPARHVDAATPDDERAAAIKAFRAGRVKVLCNVELFTEGFDLPAIDAVILLRPTRSLALFRQMIGRGARTTSPKSHTVILDHAALVAEHGLPDEEYVWTLDGKPPRRKVEIEGGERARMRRCPECNSVHEWADVCEECGHVYETDSRSTITEIGGELRELKPEPGYITRRQYRKSRDLSQWRIDVAIKQGKIHLNSSNMIHAETADKYFLRSRPNGLKCSEYARLRGYSVGSIRQYVKLGMPIVGGLIDVNLADPWVSDFKTRVKKEKTDRIVKAMKRPEVRARASTISKLRLSTPEARNKLASDTRNYFNNHPEARLAAAKRLKKQMADPVAKEKRKAAQSATMKARMADPKERAKMKKISDLGRASRYGKIRPSTKAQDSGLAG